MSTVQEREVLKEFIEVYRDNVCLWDMSSELYRNKDMKHAAWGLLTATLRKLDPDANLCTTKKKVENLRAVYFRELKKVRASQLTATDEGDIFVPNLWYFKLISFLDRPDWGPCRVSSDPLRADEVKQAPESDEESMESAELEPDTRETEIPKMRWSSSQSRKIKRKFEPINDIQTFVEPLHYTEPKPDITHEPKTIKITNSFGVYVGEQLEVVPTFQRHVAEKLISEVLFLAKTGNLNYDSKIETPSRPEYSIMPSRKETESADSDNGDEKANRPRLLKELLVDGKQKWS